MARRMLPPQTCPSMRAPRPTISPSGCCRDAATTLGGGATLADGIPVYAGQTYELYFNLLYANFDSPGIDISAGHITVPVNEADGWAIGTDSARSVEGDEAGD